MSQDVSVIRLTPSAKRYLCVYFPSLQLSWRNTPKDLSCGKTAQSHPACISYLCRKREARRLFLTMKVNLQFYYIPVCGPTSAVSSVKVRQRPLVNTPLACDGGKLTSPLVMRSFVLLSLKITSTISLFQRRDEMQVVYNESLLYVNLSMAG